MPYDIAVDTTRGYAILTHRGRTSADEIKRSGIEVIERAANEGFDRLLVDVRALENRLETAELFVGTEELSRLGPPRPRVALLGRLDQAEDMHFIENVGVNRGMPLKAFTAQADALEWLQSR